MPINTIMEENYSNVRDNREIIEASREFSESLKSYDAKQAEQMSEEAALVGEVANEATEKLKGRLKVTKDVGLDVVHGGAEFYRWIPRGVTNAVNNAMQFTQDFSNIFEELHGDLMDEMVTKGPEADLVAATGGFVDKLKAGSGQMETVRPEAPKIPHIAPAPESTTGQMLESITTFATAMYGVGKFMKPVDTAKKVGKLAELGSVTVRSMFSEAIAMDPYDQRVADLLHQVPILQGPVTEFMKSSEEDSVAVAHLKMGLEGALLGIPLDGIGLLIGGLQKAKANKIARRMLEKPGTSAKEAAEYVPQRIERGDIEDLLNDMPTEADLLAREEAWIAKEMKRDPLLTPEQVRLAGQRKKPIKVFHGGYIPPGEKFSLDHIGEGQGADSFGHGLYFAEDFDVADVYRIESVERAEVFFVGKEEISIDAIYDAGGSIEPYEEWLHTLNDPNHIEQYTKYIEDTKRLRERYQASIETGDTTHTEQLIEANADIVAAERILERGLSIDSHTYSVNLHVTADELLDWDLPISEHSDIVIQALGQAGIVPPTEVSPIKLIDWYIKNHYEYTMMTEFTNVDRAQASRLLSEARAIQESGNLERITIWAAERSPDIPYDGQYAYSMLSDNLGSQEAASIALNERGIPGLRYFDQKSRIEGEKHTRNVVIFDDNRIEITGRDGEPLPPDESFAVRDDLLPRGGTPSVDIHEGVVSVDWAHVDGSKDIKALLRDMLSAQADDIWTARRGKVTWEQTAANAEQVSAFKKLVEMGEQKGVLFNDHETLALRQLWVSSANKVKELAFAAEVGGPKELFSFRRQMAIHSLIQKRVMAVRAEQARALQQWRMPAGKGAEVAKALGHLLEDMGGEETSRRLAKMAADLIRNGKDSELDILAQGSLKVKSREALTSLWYTALLSGPHTHLRNIGGNSSVMAWQLAERKTAEIIRQIKGGGDGVAMGEAASMFHADIESFKDMMRILLKMKKMSETGFRDVGEAAAGRTSTVRARVGRDPSGALSAETWNLDADTPWGKAMDFVSGIVDAPTRALAVEDEVFKGFGRRRAFYYTAQRRVIKEMSDAGEEGLEQYALDLATQVDPGRAKALAKEYMEDQGMMLNVRKHQIIDDPDEAMRIEAEDYAAYVTFTQVPAEAPDRLLGAWQRLPWGIGRMTAPFRRTPVNLGTYGLERTPLAPMIKQWNVDMAAGGAARDLAQAKWALGSAIWAACVDMAMSGYIIGAGISQKERASNEAEDIQQNAIRFKVGSGPDDYYTLNYRGMEPIAFTLGLAANMVEMWNASELDPDEATAKEMMGASSAAIFAIMNQVTSQQYMQGIANVFEVMSDPTRLGERMVSRTAGSFVPAITASWTRAEDPYLRAAYNMIDSIKRRLPVYSEGLPFARDRMGHKRDRRSGLGTGYDLFSPIYAKAQDTTPFDAEVRRLDMYVGKPQQTDVGFDKSWASLMLGEGSVKVDLKNFPHIYDRYNELQGHGLKLHGADQFVNPAPMGQHQMLNMLTSGRHPMSAVYATLTDSSDGGKAQAIRAIRTSYQRAARERVLKEFPMLREEVIRKAMKQGARR